MVIGIAIANVIESENENASVSETGTESAIVSRTATRDGTTSVIGTANAIKTAVTVTVIGTGTGTRAALGTTTVQTIMTRTPATMDIWNGTKIETETIGLPSTLATSEMGRMRDGGLGGAREIMRMAEGMMRCRLMETKMKQRGPGKNANEVKMWDVIYRNMKIGDMLRGPRRYVNWCSRIPVTESLESGQGTTPKLTTRGSTRETDRVELRPRRRGKYDGIVDVRVVDPSTRSRLRDGYS